MSPQEIAELTAERYMTHGVRTVAHSATLEACQRRMNQQQVSALVVHASEHRPVGVISRVDLLRAARATARLEDRGIALELPNLQVEQIMSHPAVTIDVRARLIDAARIIIERHIHRLIVVDGVAAVGVLSTTDVMRAVRTARIPLQIGGFMSHPVETIDTTSPFGAAVDLLTRAPHSGLVVVEGAIPVGLFTQHEALEARGIAENLIVEDVMSQAMLTLPIETPMFRAAGFTASTRARRVLAIQHHRVAGILTGIDFARALVDYASGGEVPAVRGAQRT